MAGDQESVDLDGVQNTISAFRAMVEHANAQLRRMAMEIENISANWPAEAFVRLKQGLHNWLADFRKVVSVLNGVQSALGQHARMLSHAHQEAGAVGAVASQATAPTGLTGI